MYVNERWPRQALKKTAWCTRQVTGQVGLPSAKRHNSEMRTPRSSVRNEAMILSYEDETDAAARRTGRVRNFTGDAADSRMG